MIRRSLLIRVTVALATVLVLSAAGWFLLPAVAPWLAPLLRPFLDVPAVLNPLRLGIAFALLLVPSTAMGATLPLLVGALSRRDKRFGRVLGLLYGWNTLGAVAGAVAGEGVVLAWLGVLGTGFAAAGMNAVAAVVAFALAPRLDGVGCGERDGVERAAQAKNVPALLGAAALAGGILLALAALPKSMDNPERAYAPQAEVALYAALYALRERRILTVDEAALVVEADAVGRELYARAEESTVQRQG